MRKFINLISTAVLVIMTAMAGAAQPQLKALIIDGQNNHNWKEVTPVLKDILLETGLFTVDVATTGDVNQFNPTFSDYNVLVLNYNGADWPEATRKAFVEYVSGGGGVVVIHAADNSFGSWPEYNEIIGLGGWGGRNENSGPMIRFRDGKIVRDETPGAGGTHGPQHEYQIVLRDKNHPITKGMPEKWMHTQDELYSKLRGPAKNMTLLATAFADPEKKGTGENEPMLFTITYGKGRIFHNAMGHDQGVSTHCVGFIVSTQRGTEWVATGNVTQKIPSDFPTADKSSVRTEFKTPWTSETFKAMTSYKPGDTRETVAAVEKIIRNADVSEYANIEKELLSVINTPDATFYAKQYACKMLRQVGSDACVSTLAPLLADKEYSHSARYAMQGLDSKNVDKELVKALDKVDGDLKSGLIGTIGARRANTAVKALGKIAADTDDMLANAAINALGRIGTADAEKILVSCKTESRKDKIEDARISCAHMLLKDGKTQDAYKIYCELVSKGNSDTARVSALKGYAAIKKADSAPLIIKIIGRTDAVLRRSALACITEIPGETIVKNIAAELAAQTPENSIAIMEAIASRLDPSGATTEINGLAETASDKTVKVAALKSLANTGNASSVELLIKAMDDPDEDIKRAAKDSMQQLKGKDVSLKLVEIAAAADVEKRVRLIEMLRERKSTASVPGMFKFIQDPDEKVRKAAAQALRELAGEEHAPTLLSLIIKASAEDRKQLAEALANAADRSGDEQTRTGSIIAELNKADKDLSAVLLGVLGRLQGENALKAISDKLKSDDVELRKAALRALDSWRDGSPMALLLETAKSEQDLTNHALALRAYIKLTDSFGDADANKKIDQLAMAMEAAKRVDEKKTVIDLLVKYKKEKALDILKPLLEDAELKENAQRAYDNLLITLGNKCAASIHNEMAQNAVDGDLQTFWGTMRGMQKDDWFTVEFLKERTFKSIILDAQVGSDYPRSFDVYISADGKDWGQSIHSGTANRNPNKIDLGKEVTAKHLKIVLTSSVDNGNWWRIAEMTFE